MKNEAGPATENALAVARGMLDMQASQKNGSWSRLRLGIEGDDEKDGEYWVKEVCVRDIQGLSTFKVLPTADALEAEYSFRCVSTLFNCAIHVDRNDCTDGRTGRRIKVS